MAAAVLHHCGILLRRAQPTVSPSRKCCLGGTKLCYSCEPAYSLSIGCFPETISLACADWGPASWLLSRHQAAENVSKYPATPELLRSLMGSCSVRGFICSRLLCPTQCGVAKQHARIFPTFPVSPHSLFPPISAITLFLFLLSPWHSSKQAASRP